MSSPGAADPAYHVGLISGTSMDGIDAAVVDVGTGRPTPLFATTLAFERDLSLALDRLRSDPGGLSVRDLLELDARLGEALAHAALVAIERAGLTTADIMAIGSHGQTVWHQPDGRWSGSLQIGDAHRIAAITGVTTVADFRRADLAVGGQGAPLAPLLHRAWFAGADQPMAVVNLGGIANLTVLPGDDTVTGFDTGPANCLLDEWYRRHHEQRFDHNGAWAAGGRVDPDWLAMLLEDPYFSRPPPKSTGIEYFGAAWLERRLPEWAGRRAADIQATLAELTARTLADALAHNAAGARRVLLCGGGVHNRDLVGRIGTRVPGVAVESTAAEGLDPDHVEAVLFAWLAALRMREQPLDTAPVTGAKHPVLLGTIARPPPSD